MGSIVLLVLLIAGLVGCGVVLGYELARARTERVVLYPAPSQWPDPVRAVFALADLDPTLLRSPTGTDATPTSPARQSSSKAPEPGRTSDDDTPPHSGASRDRRVPPPALAEVTHHLRARRLLLTYTNGDTVELDEQLNPVTEPKLDPHR